MDHYWSNTNRRKKRLAKVHNTEGKVIYPVQVRHAVKVELPQFADNSQQDTHEFLREILPVLQLPRY